MRYWLESREGLLSPGTCPGLSLADARRLVAGSIDPSAQRKAAKARRAQQQRCRRW
jgi:hypothetical protein